ncbi:MAG: hypothetical protein R3E21_01090 [Caenibius sp.]
MRCLHGFSLPFDVGFELAEKGRLLKRFKSLVAGITSYRSPAFGINLVVSTASAVTIAAGIFSLGLDGFVGKLIEAYNELLVTNLQYVAAYLGIEIPSLTIHAAVLWLIFASSLTRTKHAYQSELENQIATSPVVFGDRDRFTHEGGLKKAFGALYRGKLVYPPSKRTIRSWLWRTIDRPMLRLDMAYRNAPNWLKIAFDLALFPISLLMFLRKPILARVDNLNNPEENYFSFASTREVRKSIADFKGGKSWIRLNPQQDFRYFFLGQLVVVAIATMMVILANSDIGN